MYQEAIEMYNKIMLTIIAICFCVTAYYSRKSCQLEPMVTDSEIHMEQATDKLGLTINYISQLLNIVPDTKSNGKYIIAANKGFVGRVINQIRRDYPWYSASNEVAKYGMWQIQWQYICWMNYERQRVIAEIDDLATASL
jgi:hypothetical protein